MSPGDPLLPCHVINQQQLPKRKIRKRESPGGFLGKASAVFHVWKDGLFRTAKNS